MSKHTVNTTFHPLAVLEHKILSHDNNLSLPCCEEVNSMVFLKDTIYLRDRSVSYNAIEGQILSYSLMERSWDTNISTPKEAVSGYQLAVWSGNLVLVGGHVELKFGRRQKTFKVWVHQDNKWNANIIPPVPIDVNDNILSAVGHEHVLFVLCTQPCSNHLSQQNTKSCFLCYCGDASTKQWQTHLKGPSIVHSRHLSASIVVHDSNIYAMIYSTSPYCNAFFRGHISDSMTLCDIEWRQLQVIGGDISGRAYLTVFGDNLVVAEHAGKVKLYTPFKDTSLVDIDELSLEFEYPVYGISGLSDGSLVVIGDVRDEGLRSGRLKSAVVQFKSKGTAIGVMYIRPNTVYLYKWNVLCSVFSMNIDNREEGGIGNACIPCRYMLVTVT